jgi:hypothetical protein
MGIFELITRVLRLIFSKEFSDELMDEFKTANKLRNDIIHEAVVGARNKLLDLMILYQK